MTKPAKHKYIQNLPTKKGYKYFFNIRDIASKSFASLHEAIKYRDKFCRKNNIDLNKDYRSKTRIYPQKTDKNNLPLGVKIYEKKIYKPNGLSIYKIYHASISIDGKLYSKSFSIHKFTDKIARQKAVKWRKEKEKEKEKIFKRDHYSSLKK